MNDFSKWQQWRYAGLALLLLGCVLYWLFCFNRPYSVFRAIPAQMAVVLHFPGFLNTAMPDSAAGGHVSLPEISLFRSAKTDAGIAIRLLKHLELVRTALQNRDMAVAFSLQPADSLHALYILDLGQEIDAGQLLAGMSTTTERIFPSSFKGHTLFALRLENGEKIVVTSRRNLLLFSRFSYLVEDALVQMENRSSWWTKNTFNGDRNAETEISLRIIIRTEVLAGRLRGHTTAWWTRLPDWIAGNADWWNLSRNNSGHWQVSVGLSEKLPLSDGVNWDNRQSLFSILPDNTALFARVGFQSGKQLTGFLPSDTETSDFEAYICPWVGNEAAYFIIEPYSQGMAEEQFIAIGIADSISARLKLQQYGARHGLLKQYDYQTFEVSQFLNPSLIAPAAGNNSAGFQNPACAILGNYVVFASSCPAIELLIDKYIVSQTLGNMPDFLLLTQMPAKKSDIFIGLNFTYLPLFIKNMFGTELYPGAEKDILSLQQSGLTSLNFITVDGKRFDAGAISRPVGESRTGASILWKAALSGEAVGTPTIIPLSDTGTETSVFVQDDQHHLYRFSEGGGLVWRKQTEGQILSRVYCIDFYKNGKPYFLFNTADAIWIVDDEGREMEGFPLKLQSPATNGLIVVDFYNTRSYSLFIACKNGNLYGFDQYGRPLAGWNPRAGAGLVSFPMVHFKWQNKDYLTALSHDGLLSVFNRQGAPHFSPVRLEGSFTTCPPQYDDNPDFPRIVCMNASGRVFVSNLQGQTSGLLSAGNSKGLPFLVLQDFAGNKRRDIAVLRGQDLKIHIYEGARLNTRFQHTFSDTQDTLFMAGCCDRLGSLNRRKRRIYLTDKNGTPHPAFPLAGTTPFVLSQIFPNRKDYVLIAGNGSALYAYKIDQIFDKE